MNTHLDHRADDAERMSSVGQLLRAVKRYEARPVIVCGDFNDDPGSRVIGSMKDEFVDVWGEVGSGDGLTYPAQNPARRVDYIFLSKQQGVESLRPRSARVVATNASDHLPLVVEFEISN
jgi:endonuclease/exonuclease/phosphatase family metal-dependent hydrolase